MSARSNEPSENKGTVDGPHDPEHNIEGSYALDPQYVASLTDQLLATSGNVVPSVSPINGQPLGVIPQSSIDDVTSAFTRARAAQAKWARTSIDERAAILMRFHDLVLANADEIMDIAVWESAKARRDAYNEVFHVALTARYYARTAHRHLDTQRRQGVLPGLTRIDLNRVPKGVVGIISPWNYPFTMAMSDGIPALMAGNAVVAKADSQTMLTALVGVKLLREAGFPEDLWIPVAGPGSKVGTAIIERADYICFTGSTATGKRVAAGCAERLINCSLELGGKNPIVILEDANIERASEGAVRATYSNAGQLCVSTERMFVADKIYDRFVGRFVARTEAMTLGAGQDWAIDMGSLISQDQLDTALAHIEDAVSKGATVLTGGKHRPDIAPYFLEPTILEGVTPEMDIYANETFGPVISVYRFHEETEAIALANEGCYGLNASVWTKDAKRGRAIAREIKAGTVNINEAYAATFGSLEAPMGGMRESGLGRRQGAEGIHRYTEVQSVGTQRLLPLAAIGPLNNKQWAGIQTLNEKLMSKLGRTS
ncbi:succinic semialdehyde dehydrogenase [Nocardioides jejuensis]|uniref:Succinate-semialdehyde dehydrogenase (NADP(+)) n=1 Tax=Nocardioides jejuensis TaxID=2502782 RepID=A0A4R1BW03_9ACTN|nr:succinic semialdehyde dehydrogenase [Nocardioides jejuensis]TCJ22174.1 succinate-semialdehyde dehydrogenase (NADP(+)) [Nocardioides jejuensis]